MSTILWKLRISSRNDRYPPTVHLISVKIRSPGSTSISNSSSASDVTLRPEVFRAYSSCNITSDMPTVLLQTVSLQTSVSRFLAFINEKYGNLGVSCSQIVPAYLHFDMQVKLKWRNCFCYNLWCTLHYDVLPARLEEFLIWNVSTFNRIRRKQY